MDLTIRQGQVRFMPNSHVHVVTSYAALVTTLNLIFEGQTALS